MNILNRASHWLSTMREKYLAVPVVYTTKNGEAFNLKATVGKTVFNARDEYGVVVRVETRDFLISICGFKHVPVYGDTITHAGSVYEVLAPENYCVWRWSDQYRSTRRIHTKYYKEVEE